MVSIAILLVVIIFLVILVGGLVWAVREDYKDGNQNQKEMPQLVQEQAKEKVDHLQKIKDLTAGKDKITNDDIQKLLGVSDATAERYLNELEKQGILRQKGQNKATYYEKIG